MDIYQNLHKTDEPSKGAHGALSAHTDFIPLPHATCCLRFHSFSALTHNLQRRSVLQSFWTAARRLWGS